MRSLFFLFFFGSLHTKGKAERLLSCCIVNDGHYVSTGEASGARVGSGPMGHQLLWSLRFRIHWAVGAQYSLVRFWGWGAVLLLCKFHRGASSDFAEFDKFIEWGHSRSPKHHFCQRSV